MESGSSVATVLVGRRTLCVRKFHGCFRPSVPSVVPFLLSRRIFSGRRRGERSVEAVVGTGKKKKKEKLPQGSAFLELLLFI